jgi:hypothetical protein
MTITRRLFIGLGLCALWLGCAVQTEDGGEPFAGETLALVVDNRSESTAGEPAVVGSYRHPELGLSAGFADFLAQSGTRWTVRVGAEQHRLDLAAPTVVLGAQLQSGEVVELTTGDGDARSTVRVAIDLVPEASSAATPTAPSIETQSAGAGCYPLCIDDFQADIFPASACGACGVEKRWYEGRERVCIRCGLYCPDRFYAASFACSPWHTFTSWCEHC